MTDMNKQSDMTKRNASAHVSDGLQCKGYIRGLRYVHGPVKFRYKAMPPVVRDRFFRQLNMRKVDEEKNAYQTGVISGLITEWNQTYGDSSPKAGEPLPITPENFRTLDESVQNRITNVIFRLGESDLDPDDSVEDQDATSDRQDLSPEDLLAEVDAAHADQVGN